MRKTKLLFCALFITGIFSFAVNAQDASEIFKQGLANYDARNYAQAAEKFKEVIKLAPGDTTSHYNLGLCYY